MASKLFLISALLLSLQSASAGVISPVYGDDDRQDLVDVVDPVIRRMAESTVALIRRDKLTLDLATRSYAFVAKTLRERNGVCASVAFQGQPSLSSCSGVLVGKDLLLTAGHCVEDALDCMEHLYAFGFAITQPGAVPTSIPASEVYSCKEVVAQSSGPGEPDYALIRLDREVPNHSPLAISRRNSVRVGTPVFAIGNPNGLPTKVASGAKVRDVSPRLRFVTNLDTFGGNSGSAVFNAETRLIEGLLVSGDQDFVVSDDPHCQVIRRCKNSSCSGEKVMKIEFVAPSIPPIPPLF